MKTCIIFCAADFDSLIAPIGDACIIAADGGLRHTQSLGLHPHAVIGDFDSLGYVPEAGVVHPVEKDDTDSMLAVKWGLAQDCRRFILYGSMDGPRLDHTIANFQLLSYLTAHDACGILVGSRYLATAFRNSALRFPAGCRGDFSLFCLGPDAHGVTIRGLYYPLENASLTSTFPLGVSNHFTGAPAEITVTDGTLLALWERSAGIPLDEIIMKNE